MFEKLFAPIKIRDLTLNGRAMLSACGTRFTEDRHANDRHIAYHVARAKGGCPLNMIEVTGVHAGSDAIMFLSLAKDEYVEDLKRLVDAIHEVGGKAGIQIYQGGLGVCFDGDANLLMVDLLSVDEINEVITAFGEATKRAVAAGVDCIEIHCAHQYLIHSFLSPAFNHRSDEYGGSLENRARFPLACIRETRKFMPEGMPLFIRTSIKDDFLPDPCLTIEEAIQFCKWAKEAGVDVIDLSRGNMATAANKYEVPPVDLERGFNLEYAERFKKETGMITMCVGRINDPYVAEKALEKVDMVVMSRAQICDPEFMNKCREGRVEDIVRCIGCNEGCLDGFANLEWPHITCNRNPHVGREGDEPIVAAETPRKVLIAGGGPAGMMAAKILKAEGHTPILCDSGEALGGAFMLAGSHKRTEEIRKATMNFADQLARAGVDIRLNTTVTPEMIEEIKPDAVFSCIGAVPVTPAFAEGKANVLQARDVLAGKAKASGKIVIIGSNATATDTAELLREQDAANEITVIGKETAIAKDLGSARIQALNAILPEKNINVVLRSEVTDIKNGKVIANSKGEEVAFEYDYAVLAVGCQSRDSAILEEACRKMGIGFEILGDAQKVRRALEAHRDGFNAAMRMNNPDYIKEITK